MQEKSYSVLNSTLIETFCLNNPATFAGIPHSGFLYLVFDRCFGFVLSQDKMKTEEKDDERKKK